MATQFARYQGHAVTADRFSESTSINGKIRQPKLIVGRSKRRLAAVDAQLKKVTTGPEDTQLATDSLLQGRQLPAELRLTLK